MDLTCCNSIYRSRDLLQRASTFAGRDEPWLASLRDFVNTGEERKLKKDSLQAQFSAVLDVLADNYPLLLIIDDIQWLDNSSFDLLFDLTRQLPVRPILILGITGRVNLPGLKSKTYETSPEKSLPLLLAELKRRFGQIEIDLERAGPQRNRRFVEALIDRWPNRLDLSFRIAFYQRTRGHALFAVKMIREMQASGDLFLGKNGKWAAAENLDWGRLPARIQGVIAQRLYRIDAELRQLMDAAKCSG